MNEINGKRGTKKNPSGVGYASEVKNFNVIVAGSNRRVHCQP